MLKRNIARLIVVSALPAWLYVSCASLNRTNFLAENRVWLGQELPNFHKVNDVLYRSGQPNKGGFKRLKNMGVKTIVNLRSSPDQIEKEKEVVTALGLHYVSMPIDGGSAPTDDQLREFFSLVGDRELTPILVHCLMGSDRTGGVIAAYRICVEGWSADTAYKEMKAYGFNRGFKDLKRFVFSLGGSSDAQGPRS